MTDIKKFQEVIGYHFHDEKLLRQALTHSSFANEKHLKKHSDNERLEFLGDAVIEAVTSDYLYIEFPDRQEGFLTQLRSKIVSRQSLNTIARTIGLDRYVIANPTGSTNQKHIYGDAFEAMIGAIYLDQGYEFANRLLINNIYYRYLNLDNLTDEETDFKSRLIEWCQKTHHTIAFETVHGRNYSSNHPIFDATVVIDGIRVGHGQGESKKEAEQCAAHSVSCAMSDEACGDILDKIDRLYRPKGTGVS